MTAIHVVQDELFLKVQSAEDVSIFEDVLVPLGQLVSTEDT